MSELFPLPQKLQRVEYARIYYHLQIIDCFDLPELALLQLRRELWQALAGLEASGAAEEAAALEKLLRPAPPVDPLLKKLVQKPAPPFVLHPDSRLSGMIEAGQQIVLPVLFLGRGVDTIEAFTTLLEQLGILGLFKGSGRFRLARIEAEDPSGQCILLWGASEIRRDLSPPTCDLLWWLQRQPLVTDRVTIELFSPLRLLRQKKPLFNTDFRQLFPFLLRRVSAMLAAHTGLSFISDPVGLLGLAEQVEVTENRLRWQDWRRLQGDTNSQDLGGLSGSIALQGPALAELAWVLQVGSLLNLGKGATYGAGQVRLKNG